MAKHKEWSVLDYDYTKTYPDVDYSELVTEPGLVLSMREIYNRYAAQGVDLLAGELVNDDDHDEDMSDFMPDDDLDVLQQSSLLRQRAADRQKHSVRTASKASEEADKQEPEEKSDERSEAEEKNDEASES